MEGTKCQGVLTIDGEQIPLASGAGMPGQWLKDTLPGGPGSGLTMATTHVEGHAASLMRQRDVGHAELHINLPPCGPRGRANCRMVLNKLMPVGATLDVHFPKDDGTVGTWRFTGGQPLWKEVR